MPPKGEKAPPQTTVFVEAAKPSEFKADALLAQEVCELRQRGLPSYLARKAYEVAHKLLDNPDLDGRGLSQITTGIASLARVDVETGRYQSGEPAGTINVNTNQQQNNEMTPEQLARSYALAVKAQVEAAYQPPVVAPITQEEVEVQRQEYEANGQQGLPPQLPLPSTNGNGHLQ